MTCRVQRDWSEVILKGIQLGVATPMYKSPVAGSNSVLGWDLVTMPDDATPETSYRRAIQILSVTKLVKTIRLITSPIRLSAGMRSSTA